MSGCEFLDALTGSGEVGARPFEKRFNAARHTFNTMVDKLHLPIVGLLGDPGVELLEDIQRMEGFPSLKIGAHCASV